MQHYYSDALCRACSRSCALSLLVPIGFEVMHESRGFIFLCRRICFHAPGKPDWSGFGRVPLWVRVLSLSVTKKMLANIL
jgi:hypothetical protein